MPPWKEYQEQAAGFFRSLGLDADADVTLKGVRTEHDVDVLVKLDVAGFEVRWIVECKHWKSPVTKLHVLALREIVSDLGADRGIILCEVGFQSGAHEAANLTNVQVTSLADVETSSANAVGAFRLRELYDRVENARDRYWDIPKSVRIERDLRPDAGFPGYSALAVMDAVSGLVSRALRGQFPIEIDPLQRSGVTDLPEVLASAAAVVQALEPAIADLEARLSRVESGRPGGP